jgi:hypothetical protein
MNLLHSDAAVASSVGTATPPSAHKTTDKRRRMSSS